MLCAQEKIRVYIEGKHQRATPDEGRGAVLSMDKLLIKGTPRKRERKEARDGESVDMLRVLTSVLWLLLRLWTVLLPPPPLDESLQEKRKAARDI